MASEFNETLVQLKEVLSDEKFVDELVNLETIDEVKEKLKEKNVDLTTEQIETLKAKLVNRQEGELSEDDLEDVAGGLLDEIVECFTSVFNLITEISRRRW